MRLSNKIMGIERRSLTDDAMYNLGHDDAKHDAANMAMAYDEALISAADSLELAEQIVEISLDQGVIAGKSRTSAEAVLGDIRWSLKKICELGEHQKTEGETTP